jgi:tetratricopeptide (TPR) repeat protein
VRLHELFSVDGGWCFTMDYVDGVRFDTWVRGLERDRRPSSVDSTRSDEREQDDDDWEPASGEVPSSALRREVVQPCDEPRLRAALRQLVDGVLALHGAGILHRDLKPSNVLVDRDGRVVILDFGLAATTADAAPSSSDGRFGTPAYMSPEQVRGGTLTMASDWYAVGIMLYEALTGQLPFSGSTNDMMAARLNRDPRPPQALCPEAPQDLGELCLALLHRNPTARPNGFQIAQRVGLDPTAADRPQHVLGGTFVGRTRELQQLSDAFDATRKGRTVVAHVFGPSGYGKTTLIRRFLAGLALEREVVVLEGRCYERESMPFKALDDLVDALGRYLAILPTIEAAALLPRDSRALVRLFPSLGRLDVMTSLPGRAAAKDPQELRRRAFRALRDILARLSDARPVVLFIDDVHWGDADSAQLVRNLLAPPEVPPLLLVVGYRGESPESNELLRTLRTPVAADAAWQTAEIELGPLSDTEAKQLAESLMQGTEARPPESRVAHESGGSPLLISELARFAVTHSERPQAITLQDLVAHRVTTLPQAAQRLLQLVACSSRPVTDRVLASAAALDSPDLRSHLERLRDERLIAMPLDSSNASEILHDKLRGAVLESLSEAERHACHAALAAALEQCGSEDLESIAHHHEAAGAPVRARRWLEAAAERASASLAFYRAVQLLERACTAGSLEETRELRHKLADALVNAGRGPEAASLFLELAKSAPDEGASRKLRRRAAEQYIRAGYVQEALAAYGPLLSEAGLTLPKTPSTALGSLLWNRTRLKLRGLQFVKRAESDVPEADLDRIDYCWALCTGLAGIDLVRSAHYHSLALLLALESGEPARVSRALSLHAVLKALEHADSLPVAEKHAAYAHQVADGINDSHSRGWAMAAKTIVAFGRVELDQCVELADEAIALLRERSESTFREMGSLEVWFALHALFLSGRLKELAERAPACAREAEARGDRYTLSTVRAYALALHWAVLDRPDQGRSEADAAIASWPEDVFYHQHWARLRSLCMLDLYERRGQEALERVQLFRPRMKRAMHFRIRTPRIEFNYLEARAAIDCAVQGTTRAHLGLARRRIAELRAERHPLAEVYAMTLDAGISALTELRASAAAFGKAEAEFARLNMPLHQAACAWRRAQCLGDARGLGHAESQLAALGVVNPARFSDMLAPQVPA